MSGSARNDGPPAFVVQNGNSMKYGKVILINGATISGKTSISHAIQDLLDEPFPKLILYSPFILPFLWRNHQMI